MKNIFSSVLHTHTQSSSFSRLVLYCFLFTFSFSCTKSGSESNSEAKNSLSLYQQLNLRSKMTSSTTTNLFFEQVSLSVLEVTTTSGLVLPGDESSCYAVGLSPNGSGQIVIPGTGTWWWVPFDDNETPIRLSGTWLAECSCPGSADRCSFESTSENIYTGYCVPDPTEEVPGECGCCETKWIRVDYSGTLAPGVFVDAPKIDFNGVMYQ